MQERKKIRYLYRSRTNRVISGVCGGMAEYLGIDVTLVRILFVLLAFVNGIGILLYLLALLVIPLNPNRETAAGTSSSGSKDAAILVGVLLILAGIYFLLQYYAPFWFPFDFYWHWIFSWRLFWPVLLILLGVLYIWYASNRAEERSSVPAKREPGTENQIEEPTMKSQKKQLTRSRTNKKIAGVCGGMGEYFEIDPTWIRLGWLLVGLFHPPSAILVYIIMAIVVPYEETTETSN